MAITTPFAQNGDKKEIPQTSSDGSLSFDKGFGSLYALPPEEGGLFIDREQFNQLVYQITEAILANQQSLSSLSGNVYNKGEVDNLVNAKANQSTTYTKNEVNNLVNPKADKSTTYTKNETNNLLNAKANANNVYNKSEVDTKLNGKANSNAVVNLSGNQSIRDIKTFLSLPVCNLAPTAGNHLANKAYIDSINQVPDYSAGVNIPVNKAFTPQFNGVAEIYGRAGNGYAWTLRSGDGSNDSQAIMGGFWSGGSGEVYHAGQAIIARGSTYILKSNAGILKATMYPFKSVTQASNTRNATMARTPPPAGRLTSRETSNSGEYRQ